MTGTYDITIYPSYSGRGPGVEAAFGPEGAGQGHEEVKAEFKRLRALERKEV